MEALNKKLNPYLKQAKLSEKYDPLIAYHCRLYAHHIGTSLVYKPNYDTEQSREFLDDLANQLASDKEKIDPNSDPLTHITEVAQRIFDKANNEDMSGNITRTTALNFMAASVIIDTLKIFYGDENLPQDIADKQKYAKIKATNILTCFRKGITPTPGLPMEDENENEEESTPPVPRSELTTESFGYRSEEPQNGYNGSAMNSFDLPKPPSAFSFTEPSSEYNPTEQYNPQYSQQSNNSGFDQSYYPQQSFSAPPPAFSAQPPAYSPPSYNGQTSGFSQQGFSQQGFSQQGFSQQGFSQQGFSQQGFPQQGFSQQGFSQQGFSFQGQPNFSGDQKVERSGGAFDQDIAAATRYARFALSALHFDDVPTSIQNFQIARNILSKYQIQ